MDAMLLWGCDGTGGLIGTMVPVWCCCRSNWLVVGTIVPVCESDLLFRFVNLLLLNRHLNKELK